MIKIHEYNLFRDAFYYEDKFRPDHANINTAQECCYFTMWANPKTRHIFQYIEGDVTEITCDEDAEFKSELLKIMDFYDKRGEFNGLDSRNEEQTELFTKLGMYSYLAQTRAERENNDTKTT